MAIRKFIFFNGTEGYSQEQASNDELSLGKVTLSGVSGVALDVGGADIANLGAPTGANSAARKAYVDSGLATEAAARTQAVGDLQTAISNEASTRAQADTALQGEIDAEETARAQAVSALTTAIQNEAQTRANADAALQTEIDAEETARANAISGVQSALSAEATTRANADTSLQGEIDAEEIARAAADSALTTSLNAEQTARIAADTQLAIAYAAADTSLSQTITLAYQAADAQVVSQMQAYADSLQAGFSVKAPVKAIATSNITLSGAQTVDGVSLVAGDRVLVAGQTAGQNNGIYVVAAGSWTRSADANSSPEVKDGMSVFVEQGTEFGNSTWVLITNNTITLGTTALEFVRFSGLGQISAGNGLAQSGNELSVNVGNGIQLVADAVAAKVQTAYGLSVDGDGVRVDLAALKGLEFSGGDLAVKLESDAGMEFDATNGGLELKLVSADRLSKSASGLDVVGLPQSFKIAGSAVNPLVGATALNNLVGSGSGTEFSNAAGDAYHSHSAIAVRLTTGNVAQGKSAYFTANGQLAEASCSSASTAKVAGVCVISNGIASSLVAAGTVLFPTSGYNITPGTTYYLGADGKPAEYSALVAGDRVIRLGYGMSVGPMNAPRMHVSIQDLGQKAA
jgi:hypothetical protein